MDGTERNGELFDTRQESFFLGVRKVAPASKTFTENWDSKRHLLELSWLRSYLFEE